MSDTQMAAICDGCGKPFTANDTDLICLPGKLFHAKCGQNIGIIDLKTAGFADVASMSKELGKLKTENVQLTESNRQLREQLLRLINCSASLLAHTPDFPALSDGGTAQEFLKGEIKRARELKL